MDTSLARLHTGNQAVGDSFATSLAAGLAKTPKEIACKYFYDAAGSLLFEQICELPEYYQTRTEMALLERHAGEIAALMGENVEILEFGAGSSRKVRILLDSIQTISAYTPLDISGDYLGEVVRALAADYPALTLRPVIGDFTAPLEIPALLGNPRRAGFFPGSTIGNFKPETAMALLRRMRASLDGGLLIGVDLVKDPARLHAAYNDAAGVTGQFNKNLMMRANRELAADFDTDAFAHYAPYNAAAHRIEMYLVSLKRQSVTIGGKRFDFAPGEPVHTEDSHKYTIESFREMAARAGFTPARYGPTRNGSSRCTGWNCAERPHGSGRHHQNRCVPALQHRGGGVAEEQFFVARPRHDPHHDHEDVVAARFPENGLGRPRSWRDASGDRHAIAFAQLGHVLEYAFLAQAGARMSVGLGNEQGMNPRPGGARQRQRNFSGATGLGTAIDRHEDAALAAERFAAIGENDQRPLKTRGKIGEVGREAAFVIDDMLKTDEHQVIALARFVLDHLRGRIDRHARCQMHLIRLGLGLIVLHPGRAFLCAGLHFPRQRVPLQIGGAFHA